MKTRKAKKPVRFVRVDNGYGPAENWQTVRVIEERSVNQLFDKDKKTELLVEMPGGERSWVAFWEEINTTQ